MRNFVLIFVFILTGSFLKANTQSEILLKARSSFLKGDLFGANRYYDDLNFKNKKSLTSDDLESITAIKSILLSKAEFLDFCKSGEESLFSLYCAKSYLNSGDYEQSENFLDQVKKDYQANEYVIIRTSLSLARNRGAQCLSEIDRYRKGKNKESIFNQDLILVVEARCLLTQRKYKEALDKFQNLKVTSPLYLSTIEEQAWAQYKMGNLSASKSMIKIVLSYFSSRSAKDQKFGADLYFRIRYLEAYIALLEQNTTLAIQRFKSLYADIEKYKKEYFSSLNLPKNINLLLKNIQSEGGLLAPEYDFLRASQKINESWLVNNETSEVETSLRYLIALNTEIQSVKSIRSKAYIPYLKSLERLQKVQLKLVLANLKEQNYRAKKNINSLALKSKMGQIENYWSQRTEGKKNLAEVLDLYKGKTSLVDNYLGR